MQRILLVGIGNITLPRTRHSVGHVILDSIAERLGYNLPLNEQLDGYLGDGVTNINNKPTRLALFKPRPAMNVLGNAIGKACRATVQDPRSVIVIQDTMYLEPGRMKVKYGGQPEGHRGIRSVSKFLHTQDFFRLQVGIGRTGDAKEYVLGPLSSYEKMNYSVDGKGIDEAWACIEDIAKRMEKLRGI
ncbi:peptidyl-tRNA hydrolase [Fomitiporia mediterranea MF3/22]|uniref:peptidyl-tRNA hydrolase n=1 Tax=Fomitiporia mediterranea (strain MF3/22) TaxID=694068 RepID=UPI0004407C4B|nr:peptidyl-tRNA hydrolase [Fomitiporia mediterranea MF3/22]EJD03195.1 peptidyl-tRNA hydrolase [Fomitiporia mediterranea MF3/22]